MYSWRVFFICLMVCQPLMSKFDSFVNVDYNHNYLSNRNNLHTFIWFQVFLPNTNNSRTFTRFQVFLSNTNNLHTVIWFQVFLSTTMNFKQIYLTHRLNPKSYYSTGLEWTWEWCQQRVTPRSPRAPELDPHYQIKFTLPQRIQMINSKSYQQFWLIFWMNSENITQKRRAQSAGAIKYTNCISAKE